MQWRYREKRDDQEHHENVSFFHIAKFSMFFFFVFEKMSCSSIPMFLVITGSCRKTFKQPFTDVLKNFAIFTGKSLCSVEKVFLKDSHNS